MKFNCKWLGKAALVALFGFQATYLAESFERTDPWSSSPRNVRVGRLQARSTFKLSVGVGFFWRLDPDRRLEGNAEKESA